MAERKIYCSSCKRRTRLKVEMKGTNCLEGIIILTVDCLVTNCAKILIKLCILTVIAEHMFI